MKLICFFVTLIILISASCTFWEGKKYKEEALARAYDKILLRSDVISMIPAETDREDSIKIIKEYIDNWIRKQTVLHKAEANLKNDSSSYEIQKQIDDYKSSLVRFAYEKELIRQKLDTVVSFSEIESYYNNNKNNFELKNNIIKVVYLKTNRKSPKINKAKEWYKSDSPKDRKLLEDYCHQFAENYFLDETSWLLFDDLLKEIPIRTYDKEQFLKNNRFIEIEDSTYIYLVNIKGFRIKDSLSPLVFERDNIMNILLNKRKLKLIEEMEKNAYDEAQRKKDFEIYFK